VRTLDALFGGESAQPLPEIPVQPGPNPSGLPDSWVKPSERTSSGYSEPITGTIEQRSLGDLASEVAAMARRFDQFLEHGE
jgi:hypothetical protein